MKYKFAAIVFALAVLAGCGRSPATNDQSTLAGDVLVFAASYALSNYVSLVTNKAVEVNSVHLKHGASLGETLSPTPDQLSAMGYARSDVPAGVVTIELSPKGCVESDCTMTVTAIVQGMKQSMRPVNPYPTTDDCSTYEGAAKLGCIKIVENRKFKK